MAKIETKIIKFNKKIESLIDKFIRDISKISMENRDLFPTMTDEDLVNAQNAFKEQLKNIMVMKTDDVADIAKIIEAGDVSHNINKHESAR